MAENTANEPRTRPKTWHDSDTANTGHAGAAGHAPDTGLVILAIGLLLLCIAFLLPLSADPPCVATAPTANWPERIATSPAVSALYECRP